MDTQVDLLDLTLDDSNYDNSGPLLSEHHIGKQTTKADITTQFDPYVEDTYDALWQDTEYEDYLYNHAKQNKQTKKKQISTSEEMKVKSRPTNWYGGHSTTGSRSLGYEGSISEDSAHQPFKTLSTMTLPMHAGPLNAKHHQSYSHTSVYSYVADNHPKFVNLHQGKVLLHNIYFFFLHTCTYSSCDKKKGNFKKKKKL
ncbi:hypothetical protein RFI_29708, partial [Reticulomyxa filosa]